MLRPKYNLLIQVLVVIHKNYNKENLALKLYLELKELNYEGIITKYYVTKIDTGEKLEVDEVQYELRREINSITE